MPITETRQHKNQGKKESHIPPQKDGMQKKTWEHISVTIAVPPELAYSFFRDFKNLPLFMKDLKAIDEVSEKKSHWTVEVKGITAEWDAEIVSEIPGEMISWRSVEGSEIETSGTIWFFAAPESLGTVISLDLNYKVPGGKLTEIVTKMMGEDPKSLAFTNLRRLKCFLETNELATIEGQSSGREEEAETITKH